MRYTYASSGRSLRETALIGLAVIIGSLLLVALAELLRPRRRRIFPALHRRVSNIALWLLSIVLAGFTFAPPDTFRPQLQTAFHLSLPVWPITNVLLSFILGFLLLDFLQYAIHRCQHAVPWLWRLHAMHHSDPDVDVTTSVRHHPLEYLIAAGVYWVVVLAVDMPAVVVLSHMLVTFAAAAATHGNTRFPEWLERILQPVVITLDLHLVHHSVNYQEANSNFGGVLSIWDRLLGTFAPAPRPYADRLTFGVRELPQRACLTISGMFSTPWLLGRAPARTGS